MAIRIGDVVDGYIEAMLFSSNDESDESGGAPLDQNYGPDDLSPQARATARATCAAFVKRNRAAIEKFKQITGRGDDAVGHDLWFTRNGHGVGFWDRGAGAVGEKLSKAANKMGGVDPYVGDDGQIYAQASRRRRR